MLSEAKGFATVAGCTSRESVIVLIRMMHGALPGRRVAGAGPENGASGLCVTGAGTESLDDLDMLDSVLPTMELLVEFLELPFLKKFIVCCEECFEGAKGAG